MKRIIVVALTVLLMASSVALAEENSGEEKKDSLWEMIRNKIEQVTPNKKLVVTTAVGGVRGARSEAGTDLYWRGEDLQIKNEQEMAKFESALQAAEKGETAQALSFFEGFKAEYPESDLQEYANQAIAELNSLIAVEEKKGNMAQEATGGSSAVGKPVVQEFMPGSTATP
ncbi:MAG: hypothetical protein KKB30_01270 [Proteobacteria bacterium]|nr:hypothetical protein [Pseudomonadota bacterium]MBU1714245.1 hypothetical protein [Pseudomonadota bacterium]